MIKSKLFSIGNVIKMDGLKKIFVVFFILFLVSCSSGGGGGGGSGGGGGTTACSYRGSDYSGCYPAQYAESVYETTEYGNDYGLGDISASSAYSRELTGSGVKVGIFDTGIDTTHSEFNGKTITGYNYELDNTSVTDGHGHGSHVAGTIAAKKDGVGMHGVAYGVTHIYSYDIFNNAGSFQGAYNTTIPSAISKAITAGVKVINHSWGTTAAITSRSKSSWESSYGTSITSYESLATNNIINVWAAGNQGGTQVSFEAGAPYYWTSTADHWIAVVAIDTDGKETSYTNRCGVAAAWCISAPGHAIYSVEDDGTYTNMNGTSQAAPHVSGAIAILIETFPNLTTKQIVRRLLDTASTSGLTGYYGESYSAAIFGVGKMDLDKATKPIAVVALSVGGTNVSNSTSYTLDSTKLSLSKVFGQNRVTNRIIQRKTNFSQQADKTTMASFDTYDNAIFYVNMLSLTSESIYLPFDLDSLLLRDIQEQKIFDIGNLKMYGILYLNDSDTDSSYSPFKNIRADLHVNKNLELKYNYSEARRYYLLSGNSENFISSPSIYDAFHNPYIGLNGESFSLESIYTLNGNSDISIFYEYEKYYEDLDPSLDKRRGFSSIKGIKINLASNEKNKFSFFFGRMDEEGSFLGSTTSGAFRLKDSTKTNIFGSAFQTYFNESTKLFLTSFYGNTKVDPHPESLFSDFETINSFSWSVGLLHDKFISHNSSIGAIVHQPIRAEGGSFSLEIPLYSDYLGNIYSYNQKYELEPNGREINYELFYEKDLSNYKMRFASLFIKDGGHLAYGDLEKVFTIELKSNF